MVHMSRYLIAKDGESAVLVFFWLMVFRVVCWLILCSQLLRYCKGCQEWCDSARIRCRGYSLWYWDSSFVTLVWFPILRVAVTITTVHWWKGTTNGRWFKSFNCSAVACWPNICFWFHWLVMPFSNSKRESEINNWPMINNKVNPGTEAGRLRFF